MQKRFLKTPILLVVLCLFFGSRPGARALLSRQHPESAVEANRPTPVPGMDGQTEKQKALAEEANRLVDRATALQAQVAKTNKNILSLEVVRTAEEIEMLVRRMKQQAAPGGR